MKTKVLLLASLLILLTVCSDREKKAESEQRSSGSGIVKLTEKVALWNGQDFSGWLKFVPDEGVNTDTVWTIKDSLIHCGGQPSGYLRTDKDYSNYKLTFEWRWPGKTGNSGVLLHMSEPDKVWPKCIEAQLMAENAGDFYVIGGTEMDEHIDKDSRRIEKQAASSEHKPGKWNRYEIICKASTITLKVNGVVQNVGSNTSVRSGKIGFQSEGVPIQFKNILIEPAE